MTVQTESNLERTRLLRDFLERNSLTGATVAPLADDCSFRRYFRVGSGGDRYVVMDAPPDLEDVVPFSTLSDLLNSYGYSAPRILGKDVENGFLLLDDFGDSTYTKALASGENEQTLYALALDLLVDLRHRLVDGVPDSVPAYDDDKLLAEAALFIDWYLVRGIELRITDTERELYLAAWRECLSILRAAPDTLVLRDYHVDNLMVVSGREGLGACGLLDFQDAVIGPSSYDVVSLLQDSRRDIAAPLVSAMLDRYFTAMGPNIDRPGFMRSYHAFGAQRALKVFGIFTRQSVLYGSHGYLVHISRLWRHTMANLEIPELWPVREWIDRFVPADKRVTPRPGG
ncbi:MAG: phosphotransferase, partial [Alphaproteobacteria bacterium]|nr:phosphotransferase [Alphaproteobacteria bacterium]